MIFSLSRSAEHAFLFELRDQADQALKLGIDFKDYAKEWALLVGENIDEHGLPCANDQSAQLRAQAGMFTAFEGLLTAVGRMSLILFPSAKANMTTQHRGKHLQERLGINENHALANRRTSM